MVVVAFSELIIIILFAVVLWTLNLNIRRKLLMGVVYAISGYLTLRFIYTGAYFENVASIIIALAIVPSVVVCGVYFLFKSYTK